MVDSMQRWHNWAVAAHLTGLINLGSVPFGAPLGAAVIYALRLNDGEYVRGNAANALNFQLTLALVHVLAFAFILTAFFTVMVPEMELARHATGAARAGMPFPVPSFLTIFGLGFGLAALNFGSAVYSVAGAVAANRGLVFRYLAIPSFR